MERTIVPNSARAPLFNRLADRRGKTGQEEGTATSGASAALRQKSLLLEKERIPLRPSTAHAACVGVVEEGGLLKGAGPMGGQRTNAGAPPPDVEIRSRPWRRIANRVILGVGTAICR